MKNILVVAGHTDLNDSVANQTILEEVSHLMPEVTIDRLSELYPNFQVDVAAEQEKLVQADVVVLQFPLFWYTLPSLLQRWMEKTCVRGFSHGSQGDKLQGKKLVASLTTGAPESAYSKAGVGHEINDFLHNLHAFAALCGMEYAGTVYTGGVSYQLRTDPAQKAAITEKAKAHAGRLVHLLKQLSADM